MRWSTRRGVASLDSPPCPRDRAGQRVVDGLDDDLGCLDKEPACQFRKATHLRKNLSCPRCRTDCSFLHPCKRAWRNLHRCCSPGRHCTVHFERGCPGVGIWSPQFATNSGARKCLDRGGLLRLCGCTSREQTWQHFDSGGRCMVGHTHSARLCRTAPFLHDLFGYAIYGRLLVFHHANPYIQTPSVAPHDLFYAYNPGLISRSVHGPAFTDVSAALVWGFRSAAATDGAFKALSGACWVCTVLMAARLGRRQGAT